MSNLYIGIMSGTSLDGIDLVLVRFNQSIQEKLQPELLDSLLCPFPEQLRLQLSQLAQSGPDELELMGLVEQQLALAYADAVKQLLSKAKVAPEQISAIGCHGQTIRHRPYAAFPFTYQIGDMFRLAAETQIRVIADFRRKDMAYGGQGAPLVPAFHKAIFAKPNSYRAILNIGGIANVTLLQPNQPVRGFDTGPGNGLMDNWFQQQNLGLYDEDGRYAASGVLEQDLLKELLSDPYFQLQGPKSTGREYFNDVWLEQKLQNGHYAPADVQRTLTRFTAQSIKIALAHEAMDELFVCGGGAYNQVLMSDLQQLFPAVQLQQTSNLGVKADDVEAMAFAWLAYAYDQKIPGNIPEVTGARKAVVLGAEFSC
ncbi:MAG: anhydro-N-acetylmuramic acid kinase [Gammaproteobacteria bacterium]|nr:anhydro-N-acetylmuramic acid kinase [Gammaproteobacteria bacterium]MBU2059858.1 anhydro-N-acetylmuramic acid kinase [Gammaproteobacteria bacterium]MBU2175361.1 anhydro-N-acetylmuramic acid kinase [Gammaproteobacteria bacterium]MBU2245731.1 anhydro-N-acetylmuramic acid kinase [Gammaproteobacteria bacterium]MBU2345135.1 anhydro-N-acetylmuramic acid kinase [Gammaproteobacteria bacterium]